MPQFLQAPKDIHRIGSSASSVSIAYYTARYVSLWLNYFMYLLSLVSVKGLHAKKGPTGTQERG